ncbi:MAG TPA: hypothetical protein VN698_03820 [Bacteroidia bacterium]|nr:hypothetical protein [Bacteroidia bacterium]
MFKLSAQTDTSRIVSSNTEVVFCTVTPVIDHVVVSWATSKEKNNAFFTIEKSKDAKKFVKIIDVPGSGDGKSYREYIETDYQPYKETSYYRIKLTDYNGNFKYFPTTGVVFNPEKVGKFYPDQAHSKKSLEPNGGPNQEVLVVLQDAEGVEFSAKVVITQEDDQLFATDATQMVPPGIYVIISSSDENIYSQKIIVK